MDEDQSRARDQRVREWKRLSYQAAVDMDRRNLLYQLVLADRDQAQSKEAREIANELCMVWSRVEERQRPKGVKA